MNSGFTYSESAAVVGSLADYLASRYAHTSRGEWELRISSGLVLVDGRPAALGQELARGQRVEWRRPPWEEPAAPLNFSVLYEDEHLLAVSKPSGLPTLPGAGFLEHTLYALVRARYPTAAPAHRLGRGTSGVVLFARTAVAARGLERAWRAGAVEKTYRALVTGEPARDAFDVAVPIGPVPHAKLGTVHAASRSGKSARSRVTVLERRGANSLVEVAIATGRPHQIRIHLAACGHPLVGDPLYEAGGTPRPGAVPGDCGYALHANRLGLRHPASGEALSVEAPLPTSMTPVSAPPAPRAPQ